ncbi:serine/threonine-protein phosphatase 5, partial [Reticulomyxa filosa]
MLRYPAILDDIYKFCDCVCMLQFREDPELEKQWTEAERLKEEGSEQYKKGDIRNGIALLSKAIELHPTNKVYYSNRVLMYLKTKEYEKALEDCQHIRELDPVSRYIKGHYLRGLVLYNMRKYKNAASAFQTVIKINPNFKEAIKRLDECKTHIDKEQLAKNEQRRRSSEKFLAMSKLAVVSTDNKNKEPEKSNAAAAVPALVGDSIAADANIAPKQDQEQHKEQKLNDEDYEDNVQPLKENENDIENNDLSEVVAQTE